MIYQENQLSALVVVEVAVSPVTVLSVREITVNKGTAPSVPPVAVAVVLEALSAVAVTALGVVADPLDGILLALQVTPGGNLIDKIISVLFFSPLLLYVRPLSGCFFFYYYRIIQLCNRMTPA